jgi:RimJ/RimL family protein N-acetyltransferase
MIDFPLPIIGTTIVIRAMREEDVEALYNLDTDEDVKRYVGGALTQCKSGAT